MLIPLFFHSNIALSNKLGLFMNIKENSVKTMQEVTVRKYTSCM